MNAALQSHCGKPHHIGIERGIPGTFRVFGFLLASSPEFALIQVAEDFRIDGYQILRQADITAVRHSRSDQYMERMLRAEGSLPRVGLAEAVDLRSWRSVFRSLEALGENVIVEDEDPDADRFVIGSILRVGRKSVWVRHFDGTGVWEDEPSELLYDRITTVRFRCDYINVFSKYLR